MKKTIFTLAIAAFALASCTPDSKDTVQTATYPDYNLIVDNQDFTQLAQVSSSNYGATFNYSQGYITITASDIIINNMTYSFETDEMTPVTKPINVGETENYAYDLLISKSGQTATGSIASDFDGSFVWAYWPTSDNVLSPYYNVTLLQRFNAHYTLDNRYSVQTFWPAVFFKGDTHATSQGITYSNKNSDYLASVDFKEKKAKVYVYNPEFSSNQPASYPKVICMEDIPVVMSHDIFSLQASSPKTTILGKNANSQSVLVDSVGFAATDFSLTFLSPDMTDASISYKIDGKNVTFIGSSTLK